MRTGFAHLPLHYDEPPPCLSKRIARLAHAVALVEVEEFGPAELLCRLADPFWFQPFGCVLGFDWQSSGLTTITCCPVPMSDHSVHRPRARTRQARIR